MDTDPSNHPAISVRALTKTWAGGVEAVRGIDFDVATGEVFGLLGPNGAGKSTTVGMLTTTVRPTSGSAHVNGHDVASDAIAARADSAVVFQDPVVDRALTGRRNFEIHARLWGVAADSVDRRIEELADGFDLADLLDRPVATYSGGQRRRLEIARALVSEPTRALPRRTDGRARPAHPLRAHRRHRRPARSLRCDRVAHHALPRRGGASVRSRRHHARRAHRRARPTGRPARRARRPDVGGAGRPRPGQRAGPPPARRRRRRRFVRRRRDGDDPGAGSIRRRGARVRSRHGCRHHRDDARDHRRSTTSISASRATFSPPETANSPRRSSHVRLDRHRHPARRPPRTRADDRQPGRVHHAHAPSARAQCPYATRAARAVAHPDPVRARDRARTRFDRADHSGPRLHELRRRRYRRSADPAELHVRRDRRHHRPRHRRPP